MSRKKGRKLPVFLAVVVLIIIILGVMLKWNSGYTQSVSGSTNVYNKFKDALISGGTVSLSSDDVNSLISNAFESQTHKGVTIKTVYLNMAENKINIKIPVTFKGQNFLLSSNGKVTLKDGCPAYLPDSFKIGAIPLSKNFVLNKLKAMYSSKFTVESDGIYINKSALPLTINSLEIKDSSLKIGVDKLKINLSNSKASKIRDELSNVIKDLNTSDKAKVEDAIKYIEKNPELVSDVKGKLSSVSNSEVKKIVQEIDTGSKGNAGSNSGSNNTSNQGGKKLDSETASELSNELAAAEGKVSDGAEKAVISAIQAQAASGTINTSSIMPQVNALNAKQRQEVKSALVSSINPMHFGYIRSIVK